MCIVQVEDSLFVLLSQIKKFVGRSWNYNFYLMTIVWSKNGSTYSILLSFMKEEARQTYFKEPFLLQAIKIQQDEIKKKKSLILRDKLVSNLGSLSLRHSVVIQFYLRNVEIF